MKTMSPENLRFSYHQDPKEHRRTMTVVRHRVVNGTKVTYHYACAINAIGYEVDHSYVSLFDQFRKRQGREIAEGRLNAYLRQLDTNMSGQIIGANVMTGTVVVEGHHHPVRVVLGELAKSTDSRIHRIAEHALNGTEITKDEAVQAALTLVLFAPKDAENPYQWVSDFVKGVVDSSLDKTGN